MKPELSDKPQPGLFFHGFWPTGRVEHQGQILRLYCAGGGLVQLFSWIDGRPTKQIRVDPFYLSVCTFYKSHYEMQSTYSRLHPIARIPVLLDPPRADGFYSPAD